MGRAIRWLFQLRKTGRISRYTGFTFFAVIVFFAVFYPNYAQDIKTARAPFVPTDAWQSSLLWMKDNTSDPFTDSHAYYNIYKENLQDIFDHPSYGVTSWWDYGYWITRIAHRVPNTNPAQQTEPIKKVAELFLATDNDTINLIMGEFQSKYVILDEPMTTNKFYAIADWGGEPSNKYFDYYYVTQNGETKQVQIFYAAYYQTFVTRLFNFNGQEVTNERPMVITYKTQKDDEGYSARVITSNRTFNSYAEAVVYCNSIASQNPLIVGFNPFISPIPLDALSYCTLVHSSTQTVSALDAGNVPEVKIFQYGVD